MARVVLELPSLLAGPVGAHRIELEAGSLRAALELAFQRCPTLRTHLIDESGDLRPHVLCFLNQTNSRWLPSGDAPLTDGDRITILQAVSGG